MEYKKRTREDGQLSKEDYERNNAQDQAASSSGPGTFQRATPNTLASRRMIIPKVSNKKKEFAKYIKELNRSFATYFRECVANDPNQFLVDAVQDYIDYANQLEDRYLRSYGEVMTFGSGDCGQLAHGVDEDDDLMVKYPRIVYSLRDKKVVGIACGGLHNAVCTEEGLVYTWGCADDGSLGRIGDENFPILVEGLANETIIRVACGDGQTMAVSTAGEVWGWGTFKDRDGKKWFSPQLNSTNIQRQQNEPMKIHGFAANSQIVDIACGSSINIARCSNGSLYSWGAGECGELGRSTCQFKTEGKYDLVGILRDHLTPGKMFIRQGGKDVEAIGVKAIGCGSYHSLIVISPFVYACGLNNYGQLGNDSKDSKDRLTAIDTLEGLGVVSVKGGMHHSLVLTSEGKIFAFGRGDSGQLGLPEMVNSAPGESVDVPTEVVLSSSGSPLFVESIACGSNHNLAVVKNDIYSWGYGDMLALGHGVERDEALPKKLNLSKVIADGGTVQKLIQVDGGGQHSAIVAVVRSTS